MRFLFFRNYLLFIVVLFGVGYSAVYFTQATEPMRQNQNAHIVTQGVFTLVSQTLKQYPESTWPSAISNLQPMDGNQMDLLTKSQLPQKFPNVAALMKGKTIADYNKDKGYDAPSAYKRIMGTPYILKLQLREPKVDEYRSNMAWMQQMINVRLRQTPRINWPDALKQLTQIFESPVKLEPVSNLSTKDLSRLNEYSVLFSQHNKGHIATVKFRSPDPAELVALGPIEDPAVVRYQSYIFFGSVFVALLVACFLWTYPFYRNLNKLRELSEEYGSGNFDATAKVPRTLALHPLHKNMSRMALQIKDLIQSHKDLVSAVSHELRTPLARLKFQTKALEKANKDRRAEIIKSIDEDVAELDDLIDEMLIYASFDRSKVSLNLKRTNMCEFLKGLVKDLKQKYPDKNWKFKNFSKKALYAKVDAHQMHRALQNLCLNAHRYGGSMIYVSIEPMPGGFLIKVDDDGPGIDAKNAEKIFKPFEQLDSSRNKSKKGYGLGLAIVQKILSAHGADISVKRSALGGASFEVLF